MRRYCRRRQKFSQLMKNKRTAVSATAVFDRIEIVLDDEEKRKILYSETSKSQECIICGNRVIL